MNATLFPFPPEPELGKQPAQKQTTAIDIDAIKAAGRECSRDPDLECWDDNRDCTLVEWQPRTAVYTNDADAIVIRQHATAAEGEDGCVYFRPEHIPALIRKLQQLATD
jgi:hypothetical protein